MPGHQPTRWEEGLNAGLTTLLELCRQRHLRRLPEASREAPGGGDRGDDRTVGATGDRGDCRLDEGGAAAPRWRPPPGAERRTKQREQLGAPVGHVGIRAPLAMVVTTTTIEKRVSAY